MVATTIPELHAFAKQMGLQRHWFQNKTKPYKSNAEPHYDVRGLMIARAVALGAYQVERSIIVDFLKHHYEKEPLAFANKSNCTRKYISNPVWRVFPNTKKEISAH